MRKKGGKKGLESELKNESRLTREEFAKISEVEGLRLSDTMREMFADFDRRGLSPEERRQAIIDRFKAPQNRATGDAADARCLAAAEPPFLGFGGAPSIDPIP